LGWSVTLSSAVGTWALTAAVTARALRGEWRAKRVSGIGVGIGHGEEHGVTGQDVGALAIVGGG
jgi:hypothetical protein